MTAHTPGPWSVGKKTGTMVFAGSDGGMGDFICEVCGEDDTPRAVSQANARLIAAAPELLAVALHSATALRLSGVEANAHSDNPIEWLLHQTEAAIAKAKGESDGR